MSDPAKPIFSDFFRQELKELLREVIREEAAMKASGHPTGRDNEDGLINADKAAEYLSMSKAWL